MLRSFSENFQKKREDFVFKSLWCEFVGITRANEFGGITRGSPALHKSKLETVSATETASKKELRAFAQDAGHVFGVFHNKTTANRSCGVNSLVTRALAHI